VVISIYRLTHDLLGTLPSYTTGTWLAVATEGGSSYYPLWGPALLFGLVGNLAWITGYCVFAVLFLKRRSSAPRVFIAVALGGVLMRGVDLALTGMIPAAEQSVPSKDWGDLFRGGLSAALWTAYFLRSQRVRATFVERRGLPATEPARPLEPVPP
jgi:hypothetical protein